MKLFLRRLTSSEHRFCGWVMAFAFLLRLLYIAQLSETVDFFDTVHYDQAAQSLLRGEGFGPSLHYYGEYQNYCLEPVYPIFLAAAYAVFGRAFWLVRILQALLGLGQMALLYGLAKRIGGSSAGRWTLVLSAVYPYFIFIAGLLYVTQLFSFLLCLTIWLFLRYYDQPTALRLLWAAGTAALAALSIPVFMPGIGLLLIWLLAAGRTSWSQRLRHAVLFVVTVAACLTPWTVRNHQRFGVWAPGRACVGETRYLYQMSIKLRSLQAKSQPVFDGRSFTAVKRNHGGQAVFDCYLDGEYLHTLAPIEPIPWDADAHHVGLIAYGGERFQLRSAQFGRQIITAADTSIHWQLDTGGSLQWQGSPAIQISDSVIHLNGTEKRWAYAAVFSPAVDADVFRLNYAQGAKPEQVRHIALLIQLDKGTPDANGLMIWLPPWKLADLWEVRDGRPASPKECRLYYRDIPYQKHFSIYRTILENPVIFLTRHFLPEFANFWSPLISGVENEMRKPSRTLQWISLITLSPILLLSLIGLWRVRKQIALACLILIPLLTLSMGYSLFFTQTRYRIPVDGFLLLLAGLAIADGLSLHSAFRPAGRSHGREGMDA